MGRVLMRIALAATALALVRISYGMDWWIDAAFIILALILLDARETIRPTA